MGSGTTVAVAKLLGRHFIEIEQDEKELQDFNRENNQNLQNNSSQEINPGLKDQIAALYKALEDSEDKK